MNPFFDNDHNMYLKALFHCSLVVDHVKIYVASTCHKDEHA